MKCRRQRTSGLMILLSFLVGPVGPWTVAASAAATIGVPGNQPTIQAAIDAAGPGDTVLVEAGTYMENLNFHGKAVTVAGRLGPQSTVIDGRRLSPVVTFSSGEGPSSVLTGFTIRGGMSTFDSGYSSGGVRISSSSPTVRDNVITDNGACASGGGVDVSFGSPAILRNFIQGNSQMGCSGGSGGGGISVGGAASAQIIGNTIVGNSFGVGGGVSLFAAGTPTILDNVIRDNTAGEGGGIWIVNQSDASIVQNLVVGNAGGGVLASVPFGTRGPRFVNNTVAGNTGPAGVTLSGFDAEVEMVNNIVTQAQGPAVLCDTAYSAVPPRVSFNNALSADGPSYAGSCAGAAGGNGNVSADPQFVNPAAGDYHLQPSSPSVDGGTNNAPDLLPTDLDGKPRIVDSRIDQGVYELQQVAPPGPPCTRHLTGNVAGPVVVFGGEHVCASAATIADPVVVTRDGAVTLSNSVVLGGVSTSGAAFVRICDSRIGTVLAVVGSSGPVTVGDPAAGCGPNQLSTPGVNISGNHGGTTFAGNQVTGTVAVNINTGDATVVSGNLIHGNLVCFSNSPVPTGAAGPNTVIGGIKAGQCAAL